MNLAIDIGNTFIKTGLFKGRQLIHSESVDTELTSELLENWLKEHPITHLAISSVRNLNQQMVDEIKQRLPCLIADYKTPMPINILYDTPNTLGIDRVCAAVAGRARYSPLPVLVIDAGTCITYEFVDASGNYLGGAISPGVRMRLRAMNHFTDKLPLVETAKSPTLLGTSTEGSLQTGAINGARLEMKGFIDHFQLQHQNLKVILTGGDQQIFEQLAENVIFAAQNLVLEGLNEILLFNQQRQ